MYVAIVAACRMIVPLIQGYGLFWRLTNKLQTHGHLRQRPCIMGLPACEGFRIAITWICGRGPFVLPSAGRIREGLSCSGVRGVATVFCLEVAKV